MRTTLFILTLALAGSTLTTRANDRDSVTRTPGASTAEVKYVGGTSGERIFHVSYNNPTGSRFSVKVLDADGTQLYQSVYTDKLFNKKFQLDNIENSGKVVFMIRNFGDGSVQSFEVNTNTRLVEDVDVKEVK